MNQSRFGPLPNLQVVPLGAVDIMTCKSYGGDHDYCVQRTQEIYGRLQERWESIPAEVRGRCLKWLKTSSKPDSYYQLVGCVLGSAMRPPTAYGYAPPPWGYYYRY